MKKILILCTGNSCRSIIAEALINNYLDNVKAFSAGSNPTGEIHPFAKKLLKEKGLWDNTFYSKSVNNFINERFDIVITVCDNAKETCPYFPNAKKIIHIPFNDPAESDYQEFVTLFNEMKEKLLNLF